MFIIVFVLSKEKVGHVLCRVLLIWCKMIYNEEFLLIPLFIENILLNFISMSVLVKQVFVGK